MQYPQTSYRGMTVIVGRQVRVETQEGDDGGQDESVHFYYIEGGQGIDGLEYMGWEQLLEMYVTGAHFLLISVIKDGELLSERVLIF